MKHFYFFIFILISNFTFSQNFTDTKGELQISVSGTATYNLPIATPPSIKSVAPIINLTYSSGVRGGIAGQGWSINSISAISRISTRRDIDGFVDGVDFDDNDKLALDGQRLLIKTGTYWASGSTYETEYKSNTRIELKTEGSTVYFIVTAPDGSRSWYGSKGSGSLQNSVSLNSWYIVHYEDVNGNFIDYNYKTVAYAGTNQLYIDNIAFSGNSVAGVAAQNKISFNYRDAKRVERDYLKGVPVYATQILSNIQVFANNNIFRTYKLTHLEDTSLGYERITNVQEINAQNEVSNPVEFKYDSSPVNKQRSVKEYTNNLAFDKIDLTGDFDGDGRLDFVANDKLYINLFKENSGNAPINLPFISNVYNTSQTFTATTLSTGVLNQFNSIINAETLDDRINFRYYKFLNNAVVADFVKTLSINNSVINKDTYTDVYSNEDPYYICGGTNNCAPLSSGLSTNYTEGDFNGDGISEVLIEHFDNEYNISNNTYVTTPQGSCQFCTAEYTFSNISYYIVDLNPNSSTNLNSKGFHKIINASNISYGGNLINGTPSYSRKFVGDFNGDGKSDILTIKDDKTYKIISFNQLNTAPWTEVQLLGSGTIDKYSGKKQILLGDYNGDGKMDIMLPDGEGGAGQIKWHIYYSNANPAGGEFFTKESHDIVEYRPDTSKDGTSFDTQVQFSTYYAMDINGDGKSDLVRVWRKYYKPKWTINDHNTQWQVTTFTNNVGKVGGASFVQTYDSGVFDADSPDIPIPITSNYKYNGSNTDLVVVRGHKNLIEYYQFNKNVDTENRLISVTESSGNIKQIVDYKPMEAVDGGLGNSSTDFYSSGNSVAYPNIEIIRNPISYLVSKLTATINGVSKYQDFRYRGFVSNFNYGTVGFIKTSRSSWYLSDSDAKIWTTQYNDVALRGANTITWSSTDGTTVFNSMPNNLLSTKTNEFAVSTTGGDVPSNTYTDQISITSAVVTSQNFMANNSITASSVVNDNLNVNYQAAQVVLKPGFNAKGTSGSSFRAYPLVAAGTAPSSNSSVYNVLLKKQTSIDHLTDTKTETTFTYDGTVQSTNYFGLETQSVTKQFSSATLQGTTTVDTDYDNNPTGAGSSYYIGRPKKVNSSSTVYTGDNRTSEEKYTYTGSNLTKTEKKGHNTYPIVEDMTYDSLGNLLTKTVSAPAAPTPPVPRTITDEYDVTKRFVTKKTDHQGFVTNFIYNTLGQVTKSTDYLGVINDYVYDNWGKLINTTTQNVSSTPLITNIVYTKLSDGGYTTTTTNNTDAATTTRYDVLGRAIVTSTKGFTSGSLVYKQVVYDGLGRKKKESEPYFSSPNQWTVYEYDYLMRPVTVTAHTGKIQTLSYAGLTTTSNDDGKITTVTIDALGNKTQTTDPGGTVNFIYYANGQLKESDYQGNKVSISIDGWGNKIAMTDPSAGTYTYSYDAFGQIKTETTPNGTTAYVYDTTGKTVEKTIVGTNTNSKTTYVYNPSTNLITSSSFVNNLEGNSITNSFEYDNYKRISKTIENTPYASFTKEITYDTFGRADIETSTAAISGKSSSKTVKHTYQNGFAWQLVDNANQQVLWQTNSLNERGQLTSAGLGNGIGITNLYDQYGYASVFKFERIATNPGNVMTLTTLFEPKRGNLTTRTNNLFNWNENFTYDELDRLLTYNNALAQQETQSYDVKGKITQNSVGTYNYTVTGKTYQNNSITLSPQALSDYQNRGTGTNSAPRLGLEVTYNTFKSPATIKERGRDGNYIDYLSFTYNDGNDRSTMFYGGGQEDKLLRPLRKHYSGDGTMEIKENRTTGAIEFITYIGGDGYSAPIVFKSDGITQDYLYLHRDYQGTILAVTDNAGAIVEKRLFDAWGAVLKVQNGAGTDLGLLTVLDRGYTGHEHLQSVGIINMNGRLYDPKLHRFLQPDNFIQDPANTQNYNRYGYVLNNPLKYTDPSGEEAIAFGAVVIIGAIIAATTYTLTALLADVPFTVGGLLKATFIGAASSAVTFGIGSASSALFTNFYSQAAFSAAAHGTFQGGMTAISGGKFWSGFAAGALSSMAASAWSGGSSAPETHSFGGASFTETFNHQGLSGVLGANNSLGMVAFGTVSGGVGAKLTGGNFWQGAVTGLVVSGLNHYAHKIIKMSSLRENIEKGGLDPDAKPEMTSTFITGTLNKKVNGLQASYEAAGRPSFLFSDGASDNVAEHNLSSSNRITIYEHNAKTIYRLVSSLFHEYRHAYQVMTNFYSRAEAIHGPLGPEGTYSKLRSLIEWDAYNYQIKTGKEVDGFIFGQRNLMKKYFEHK
ncbi:RHS repeat-associated core domain-containing protein [Flavobacterium aquidurense]|uniref:Putative penicillin-binding protein n=1 Tax=Flavobacterium aquidurense TaxID=362413 RepID=A0A0Q0XPD4_9FLAO|nr:RHS repeat-associated core domain-containing protein [Flavobacterium aquidurense]KQB37713.1 putative penicillin-binding protein [Flavobacterium aquidurense]